MSLDLDRITHPLRLASGSHQPGSGKGCAMNVISYINGDTQITDFPECSARPLARIVQSLNDRLAGGDGFLSPEDSVVVLDIGWRTVGTAAVPREVVWHWLSDLLVHPEMGVVKLARPDGEVAIRRVAELLMRFSRGEPVSAAEWSGASSAAQEARKAAYANAAGYANAAAAAAVDAAAAAAAAVDAYAAAAAAVDAYAKQARITFTRWAVERWRELAGLDEPQDIDAAAVDSALVQIGG
ncbi:conserved hypothetical protein [uncultured Mycobacterium sp.]|uniref:Uncharacterized protein n=1 Tax=uncultured Mycobacterium sp. TaxID=171292 RepID=A0A1Y5P5B4_9MYCO|nr:conserved hypothetical protein [uncultured Mycobacterium sp.]